MIEHDFPSKRETKQTYPLSTKTRHPLLAPTIPKIKPHEPGHWGPTKVMNLGKVSATGNRTDGGKWHSNSPWS